VPAVAKPRRNEARVMTFMVNQDGVVHQKDLGDDTLVIVAHLETCNPDGTWTVVK
jgi:hypothetical protein